MRHVDIQLREKLFSSQCLEVRGYEPLSVYNRVLNHRVKRKKYQLLNCIGLFATPWIVAHQAPLCMELSRKEYWNGQPFPSPVYLPKPGIKPGFPTLQAESLPSEPLGSKSWLSNKATSSGNVREKEAGVAYATKKQEEILGQCYCFLKMR